MAVVRLPFVRTVLFAGAMLFASMPLFAADAPKPGTILFECWRGINGNSVADLTGNAAFKSSPADGTLISAFEIPADQDENYGTRVRGFVHPPLNGDYTFWISSDDGSELWLSPSDNPAQKIKIASCGCTGPRAYDQSGEQKSKPVKLAAGRKYYIEALHKEGGGGDHLSVGWQLPDGKQERPIPGSRLSPAAIPPKPAPPSLTLDPKTSLPTKPGHHRLSAQAKGQGYEFALPYVLYLPLNYDKTNDAKPVVIFLHGAGECGTDLNAVYSHGPAPRLRDDAKFREAFPFIALVPQCIPGRRWNTRGSAAAVCALLDELAKKVRIDTTRVYITGLSMGGMGTWVLALEAPEKFAAIAPLSAVAVQPDQAPEKLKEVASWIIVGEQDGGFTEGSKVMHEKLSKAGVPSQLTVVPGMGHGGWERWYNDPKFYEWFLKYQRRPGPRKAENTRPGADGNRLAVR